MAVPDWPTTYGYNPFLYPLATWLHGPWDVFVEHGHGCSAALRRDDRDWFGDRRLAARIGGDGFAGLRLARLRWFAFKACSAGCGCDSTSATLRPNSRLRRAAVFRVCRGARGFHFARLAVRRRAAVARSGRSVAAVGDCHGGDCLRADCAWCAASRHGPTTRSLGEFRAVGLVHLSDGPGAAGSRRARCAASRSRLSAASGCFVRPASLLCGLISLQIGLGLATWVTHYGFPSWLAGFPWAARYTVTDRRRAQIHLTTAHVACRLAHFRHGGRADDPIAAAVCKPSRVLRASVESWRGWPHEHYDDREP